MASLKRVLIVDDLIDNLFLTQTFLEAEGYQVETANSGKQALIKVWESPPELILLDVMMPGMDGYEVVRQIRQNSALASIPILLLTAHDESTVAKDLELSISGFVRKPIDFDDLLSKIRSHLPLEESRVS